MAYKIKKVENNDAKLIYLISDNNDDAKDYLYQKYSPLIHKEINKVYVLARKKGIDKQELVQEAMVGFSEALNSYSDKENVKFITFATMCVQRKLNNLIKKFSTSKSKIIKNQLSLDAIANDNKKTYADLIESYENSPLEKVIINEELKIVNFKFANTLSENEKAVLIYSLEGKNPKEIAIIMNISIKQVYNFLYRARKKLKIN